MDYFIMQTDERIALHKEINYAHPGFRNKEPFVTFGRFNEDDRCPDFFHGRFLFDTYFCVTDQLKEILEAYSTEISMVPFFLTDEDYRSQIVCWNMNCPVEECFLEEGRHNESPVFHCEGLENKQYIFCVRKEKALYLIVSLELAENILRRQLYGIRFTPVSIVWKEGKDLENNHS